MFQRGGGRKSDRRAEEETDPLHCQPAPQLSQGDVLYVQEVVTQPKILNRTILYNRVHVT